jgi:integrase
MPHPRERLKLRTLGRLKAPGYYADGAGLYLQIGKTGARSWIFRYMLNGRAREMGLGPEHIFSLAEARERAAEARKLRSQGTDPIEHRHAQKAAKALEAAKSKTFSECAAAYIAAHRSSWRNPKHAAQWTATIATYCKPIAELPIQGVDVGQVLKALEPIWTEKPETANRLRGRIEHILDWARVRGYRQGENPARWRGTLDKLLPDGKRRQRIKHHAALAYVEAGTFMKDLRAEDGTAARALEFTTLTAARTGETIGARWLELDLDLAIWIVPAERMKGHREHRVPLSPAAVRVLRALPRDGQYVFPGRSPKKPLSNMAMLKLLGRMGRGDLTTHGFRSTFRDWAAERTNFPNHVVEMALAHAISDATEASYRRGDLFEKRRRLMAGWASYLNAAEVGKVAPIRKVAA